MIHVNDVHSLTEFRRNTRDHVKRIKRTGRPVMLTVNGKAELVVQDARAYQRLLDALDRAEAIEGIREGLASMDRGEGRPAEEVFAEIRRKHFGAKRKRK